MNNSQKFEAIFPVTISIPRYESIDVYICICYKDIIRIFEN